jgi:hypothetical protein
MLAEFGTMTDPGYHAWIVTVPDEPAVTVTGATHWKGEADSVQTGEENETVPVPPVCDHTTGSPVIVPLTPLTNALHVVDGDGEYDWHEMVVVVTAETAQVRVTYAEVLAVLLASPG